MPHREDPVGKTKWVACRNTNECEGKEALVLMVVKIKPDMGGGTAIHYRCTTCKKRFSVRF